MSPTRPADNYLKRLDGGRNIALLSKRDIGSMVLLVPLTRYRTILSVVRWPAKTTIFQ